MKITAAYDVFGTWRGNLHDDLVLAVALAAWDAHRHQPLHLWAASYRPTYDPDSRLVERSNGDHMRWLHWRRGAIP